jgi:hypothetical protein
MLHVLNHAGQYFRVEIAEVASADKTVYVGWCSNAFTDLKDAPSQACSRFVAGSPFANAAEALGQAQAWIRATWDSQQAWRASRPAEKGGVVYTVWLFKGDVSTEHQFPEFWDAKLFAEAAEKDAGVTKVGITNNESPQYLTLWERSN